MEYLKDTFVYKLLAAKKKMVSAVKQDFQEVGITHEIYIVLHFIYENPGITQKELSELSDKDTNVIVRTIDKLEKMQLVRRVRGESDRRSFSLFVTENGEEVVNKYWDRLVMRQEECLNTLTADEKRVLTQLLDKILDD